MKRFFLQCLTIIIFSLSIFSQILDKPELIDEFRKVSAEDLQARLEVLPFVLSKSPNSIARFIIYRGKDSPVGFPIRFGIRIKIFLVNSLNIQPERFQIFNCGLSSENLVRVVLFPPNYEETSPHGICAIQEIEYLPNSKTPFLFDKFWYQLRDDMSECCVTDNYGDLEKNASLDAFAEKLKDDKTQQAVLMFYSYKCAEKEFCKYNPSDSTKLAKRVLKRERNYLIKQHKISPSKIIIINGGFNLGNYSGEARRLELWLVAKGSEIPKPKPDYFPKKRRSKK